MQNIAYSKKNVACKSKKNVLYAKKFTMGYFLLKMERENRSGFDFMNCQCLRCYFANIKSINS